MRVLGPRIEAIRSLYEQAVFDGEVDAVATAERELDAFAADLALARGQVRHARFLTGGAADGGSAHRGSGGSGTSARSELADFEEAAERYERVGDKQGRAEALFWLGCFHQVIGGDDATAVPILERSRQLADEVGDQLTLSYALRHLGIAAHRAGRLESARGLLEESVRLRRELGFERGVAANLVGLAYIAMAEGRVDDATLLLDDAGAITTRVGAHQVQLSVDEARTALADAR